MKATNTFSTFISQSGVHLTDYSNELTLPHKAKDVAIGCVDNHLYLFVLGDKLYCYKWHITMVFIEAIDPEEYDVDYKAIDVIGDKFVFQLHNGEVHKVGLEDIEGMSEMIVTTNMSYQFVSEAVFIEYSGRFFNIHRHGIVIRNEIAFSISCVALTSELCVFGTKGGQILIYQMNSKFKEFEMYHWHPSMVSGIVIQGQNICSVGKEAVLTFYHLQNKTKDFIPRIHRGSIAAMVGSDGYLLLKAIDGAIYAIKQEKTPLRLFTEFPLCDPNYSARIVQHGKYLYVNSSPGLLQVVNENGDVVDEINIAPNWNYAPKLGKIKPFVPVVTDMAVTDSTLLVIINSNIIQVFYKSMDKFHLELIQKASSPVQSLFIANDCFYLLKSTQLEQYSLDFKIKSIHKFTIEFESAIFSNDASLMLAYTSDYLIVYSITHGVLKEIFLNEKCNKMVLKANCVYCLTDSKLVVVDLLSGSIVSSLSVINASLVDNILVMNKNYKLSVHEVVEAKRRQLKVPEPFSEVKLPKGCLSINKLNGKSLFWTQFGFHKELAFVKKQDKNKQKLSIYDLSKQKAASTIKIEKHSSFIEPLKELFDLENEYIQFEEADVCELLMVQMAFNDDMEESSDKDMPQEIELYKATYDMNFDSKEFKKPPAYIRAK